MPAPGSKKAPKTFDGNEDEIADFLEVFERCAEDARLHKANWVKSLFQYLTRAQLDVFYAFDGRKTDDWDAFKTAIEEAFGGAFKSKKYTIGSLDVFLKASARRPILRDRELRTYRRQFHVITTDLIRQQELSVTDKDRLFWSGFHQDTRHALERRLAVTRPDHPRSTPFTVVDVYKAGMSVVYASNRATLASASQAVISSTATRST